ncbi:hypothetical protein [Nocardioides sp. T2.26MG-1]|uniref:hypothetical protein n=1 Tax=Nocardioides sp. T2.26MG-1 TaxID=3041166 RepID=UPI0024777CCB|nr:hypothetical protein [Nocardioides sp. T2.26MG-1]CAI9412431.1 hypothetical protein HIDPHFAB_01769 [Nocardioides sp. T2.26MG-1]
MNHHLSDETVAGLPLSLGRAELLEEIMSTPVLDDRPVATADRRRSRWLVPTAVAAAVALLVGFGAWWGSGFGPSGDDRTGQVATAPGPETSFRAVLDAPGWTVDNVYTDSRGGELSYVNGDLSFEINWYPADSYADYVEDRRHITDPPSDGEPVEVLGLGAQMWAYSDLDHTAIREPEAGHWIEARGDGMDEAAYVALLGQLRLVDEHAFEAAMPASYVDGSERDAAIQQIIDGIGEHLDPVIPPGSQRVGFSSDQNDPYHLGADVAGAVACEWLADFDEAHSAGDQQRMDRAAAALATARDWPVLQDMEERGDYAEVVYDYADQVARGQVPEGYAEGLGCEG